METGGNVGVEETETSINIAYLIARYMRAYNETLEETLNINWFVFNELLKSLNIIESEIDYRNLLISDNHLKVQMDDKQAFPMLYKSLESKMRDGVETKRLDNDLDKLFKVLNS